MPHKSSSALKNTFLLLAPVALLGGVGWLLQNRKPAVLTMAGPFEMFVKKVRFVPVTPKEVHEGYDTKIEVELGARGKPPMWWQKGFAGYSSYRDKSVFFVSAANRRLPGNIYRTTPHLDNFESDDSHWITTYLLKLSSVPGAAGEIRLKHRIQVEHNGTNYGKPLWLDTIVCKKGQKIQQPVVSRDPHLRLAGWTLDHAPPVDSGTAGMMSGAVGGEKYQWRLILEIHKLGPLSERTIQSWREDLYIRDAEGQRDEIWGSQQEEDATAQATDPVKYREKKHNNPSLFYSTRDMANDGEYLTFNGTKTHTKMKAPVYFQGDVSWNDNWPLSIKIPFRDAQGRVLLTPRPAPPFKVVSTSLRVANASETRENGSDTIVQVVLKPLNPKIDVAKWRCQGNFSQHIQDAKGAEHWLFPFKGMPRQVALVAYEYQSLPSSEVRLRYHFILSSIPKSAGKLTFHAEVSANGSRRVPVSVVVRP